MGIGLCMECTHIAIQPRVDEPVLCKVSKDRRSARQSKAGLDLNNAHSTFEPLTVADMHINCDIHQDLKLNLKETIAYAPIHIWSLLSRLSCCYLHVPGNSIMVSIASVS